jgi:hypothetical protein
MNKKRLVADRALYKRVVISFFDLHEARSFLQELLRDPDFPEVVHRRSVVQRALMTAFVTAYARPFSDNEQGELVRPNLPASVLRGLSIEQKQVHKRLLTMRNQEFAHSDPDRSNVQVGIGRGPGGLPFASPISDEVRVGPSVAELRIAETALTVIITKVHDELNRLQTLVVNGTPF